MKIIIAGASGAIGQPLISLLVAQGHDVYGITQSEERSKIISEKGAHPIILNVLDREAVFSTLAQIKPDTVIDMLTHLPKEYTPESMRKAAKDDAILRLVGGSNLQEAAEMHGTKRYIAQSSAFWYEPGIGLADEDTPFAFNATPGIASGTRTYAEIEKRLFHSDKIEAVGLRFGFFYGPGTWFHLRGDVANQIQKQEFPIIGNGEGVWNFIHVEDAAIAIVSSLEIKSGIYNVVNDQPSKLRIWLPAFAKYLGASSPPIISEDEGVQVKDQDTVYYATKLRGASNAKFKKMVKFKPRPLDWLLA